MFKLIRVILLYYFPIPVSLVVSDILNTRYTYCSTLSFWDCYIQLTNAYNSLERCSVRISYCTFIVRIVYSACSFFTGGLHQYCYYTPFQGLHPALRKITNHVYILPATTCSMHTFPPGCIQYPCEYSRHTPYHFILYYTVCDNTRLCW